MLIDLPGLSLSTCATGLKIDVDVLLNTLSKVASQLSALSRESGAGRIILGQPAAH